MLKLFNIVVAYAITPAIAVIGMAYGFDKYVISRAETVVKPVEARVTSLESGIRDTNAMLRVMGSHMLKADFDRRVEEEKLNNP
jgi:hypothetical protein